MIYTYWPGSLPLPLQSGYQHDIAPSVLRTEMTDGHVRQRLLNANAPETLNVTVQLDRAQLAVFREFWRTELNFGTEYFIMPVLNAGAGGTEALENRLVRIQNGAYSLRLVHRNHLTTLWQIGLKLDVFSVAAIAAAPENSGSAGRAEVFEDWLIRDSMITELAAEAITDTDRLESAAAIETLDLEANTTEVRT